jgi:hypothetical protein
MFKSIGTLALLGTAIAVGAFAFAGCSKHPTRPFAPSLNGTVVDATSHPVAQARIAVLYHVELTLGSPADTCGGDTPRRNLVVYPNPAPSPHVYADILGAGGEQVEMSVTDRSGTLVRNLASFSFPSAARHVVVWDGKADDGSDLPNGIYVIHWKATKGDSVFAGCRRVLLNVVNVDDLGGRTIATTAGSGRFSIPMSSLPIHDGGQATDSAGNHVGGFSILSDITLCALASAAPGASSACLDTVRLGDLGRDVTVTVHLP